LHHWYATGWRFRVQFSMTYDKSGPSSDIIGDNPMMTISLSGVPLLMMTQIETTKYPPSVSSAGHSVKNPTR